LRKAAEPNETSRLPLVSDLKKDGKRRPFFVAKMVLSMHPSSPKLNNRVTFAIARDKPLGVVIVTYNSKLSRVFHWDLTTDTFTPSQFLKARANVLAISADGKYFGYQAESYRRGGESYVCVAKLGWFTALAFFPYSVYFRSPIIHFLDSGDIFVCTKRDPPAWFKSTWQGFFEVAPDRITPGFDHQILRDWKKKQPNLLKQWLERIGLNGSSTWNDQNDDHNHRIIFVRNNELLADSMVTDTEVLLATFVKEPSKCHRQIGLKNGSHSLALGHLIWRMVYLKTIPFSVISKLDASVPKVF
jgi:hypothetical protein